MSRLLGFAWFQTHSQRSVMPSRRQTFSKDSEFSTRKIPFG